MSWSWWLNFASVFKDIAVGIGAILAGAGALSVIDDWRDKRKHESQKKKWTNSFPADKVGKDFNVVQSKGAEGVLYIQDLKAKKKHWIVDPFTLRALGLSYSDAHTLSVNEFQAIDRGSNIQIQS